MKDINLGEGFLTALFIVLVVFAVLALVYILIRAVSAVLRKRNSENQTEQQNATTSAIQQAETQSEAPNVVPEDGAAYGGSLKLQNVDDQTAAMIMAIISDTSGIPLSELCFKSIRLITE